MNNRICLVTGAGRGIGRNIARLFCREGYVLALTDIDQNLLEQTKRELLSGGAEVEAFSTDLSISGASQKLIERVVKKFGKLDVLINNARAGKRASFQNESEENWDLTLNVNLKAPFLLAQAAVLHMQSGSSIINIGSISGQLVSHESPSYQVSKAGLMHLNRYLAVYAGKMGIRVNAILPGFIIQDEHKNRFLGDTPEQLGFRRLVSGLHPGGIVGSSDDIANTALMLDRSVGFITGQSIVVDGGLTTQDPTKVLFDYVGLNSK